MGHRSPRPRAPFPKLPSSGPASPLSLLAPAPKPTNDRLSYPRTNPTWRWRCHQPRAPPNPRPNLSPNPPRAGHAPRRLNHAEPFNSSTDRSELMLSTIFLSLILRLGNTLKISRRIIKNLPLSPVSMKRNNFHNTHYYSRVHHHFIMNFDQNFYISLTLGQKFYYSRHYLLCNNSFRFLTSLLPTRRT